MREIVALGFVAVACLAGCSGEAADPQPARVASAPAVRSPSAPSAVASAVTPRAPRQCQVVASLRLVQGRQETVSLIHADLSQGEDGLWEVSSLTHDGRAIAVF